MDKSSGRIRTILIVICVPAGLSLLIAGATWKATVPSSTLWTPEQAREYTAASRAVKIAATHEDRHAGNSSDPQLIAAKARFDQMQAKLDRAILMRDYAGAMFFLAGVGFLLAGAWLYWGRSNTEPTLEH
jgi:hypothetical protein